jgi:hypothetical protein
MPQGVRQKTEEHPVLQIILKSSLLPHLESSLSNRFLRQKHLFNSFSKHCACQILLITLFSVYVFSHILSRKW